MKDKTTALILSVLPDCGAITQEEFDEKVKTL